MLTKARGIVIKNIHYGETSLISKILLENEGIKTFLTNGVRSKKGKFKPAHFQIFTLLELDYYAKENANFLRIKEAKLNPILHGIQGDIPKILLVQKMADFASKIFQDNFSEAATFYFFEEYLLYLNENQIHADAFYLHFLISISNILGISLAHLPPYLSYFDLEKLEKTNTEFGGHKISVEEQEFISTTFHWGISEHVRLTSFKGIKKLTETLEKFYTQKTFKKTIDTQSGR